MALLRRDTRRRTIWLRSRRSDLKIRSAILVHRQELLRQSSKSLTSNGVTHGIIAPGYTPSNDLAQVASIRSENTLSNFSSSSRVIAPVIKITHLKWRNSWHYCAGIHAVERFGSGRVDQI